MCAVDDGPACGTLRDRHQVRSQQGGDTEPTGSTRVHVFSTGMTAFLEGFAQVHAAATSANCRLTATAVGERCPVSGAVAQPTVRCRHYTACCSIRIVELAEALQDDALTPGGERRPGVVGISGSIGPAAGWCLLGVRMADGRRTRRDNSALGRGGDQHRTRFAASVLRTRGTEPPCGTWACRHTAPVAGRRSLAPVLAGVSRRTPTVFTPAPAIAIQDVVPPWRGNTHFFWSSTGRHRGRGATGAAARLATSGRMAPWASRAADNGVVLADQRTAVDRPPSSSTILDAGRSLMRGSFVDSRLVRRRHLAPGSKRLLGHGRPLVIRSVASTMRAERRLRRKRPGDLAPEAGGWTDRRGRRGSSSSRVVVSRCRRRGLHRTARNGQWGPGSSPPWPCRQGDLDIRLRGRRAVRSAPCRRAAASGPYWPGVVERQATRTGGMPSRPTSRPSSGPLYRLVEIALSAKVRCSISSQRPGSGRNREEWLRLTCPARRRRETHARSRKNSYAAKRRMAGVPAFFFRSTASAAARSPAGRARPARLPPDRSP